MSSDLTDRISGIRSSLAVKAPCRVATTVNVALSGLQTIDGVALAAGDRVLVKSQTDGTANGIYVTSTSNWQRAKDFDGTGDLVRGTRVYAHSGTLGFGEYIVTTADPIMIGTSNITFEANTVGVISLLPEITLADDVADYLEVYDTSAAVWKKVLGKNLGFTPAGTGAVLRTLQGKLRERVDVRDFGVVGDGVADDTTGINNAIAQLGAAGGGILEITAGFNCKITSTITIDKANVLLRGLGADTFHDVGAIAPAVKISWHGATDANANMIVFTSPTGASNKVLSGGGIEGIMLDARRICGMGLKVLSRRQLVVRDVFVLDATNRAFWLTCGVSSSDYGEAADNNECLFERLRWRLIDAAAVQAAHGVYVTGSSNANTSFCKFRHCLGQTWNGTGWILENADNNIFENLRHFSLNSGIDFDLKGPTAGGLLGAVMNYFIGCSWGSAAGKFAVRGTESGFTAGTTDNVLLTEDTANSASAPSLGTGCRIIRYMNAQSQRSTYDIGTRRQLWKNALINPEGALNQRAPSSNADDTYGHDRWYALTQSNPIAVSTQTDVADGTPSLMRLTQSNAVAQRVGYAQIIESVNCKSQRGRKAVLSGSIRCSASQAIRYAILEWTGTANAVTSDVVNDWASGTYTAGNFFLGANLTVSAVGVVTAAAATLTALTDLVTSLGSSFNNLIVFLWTEGTAAQNLTLDLRLQLEFDVDFSTMFERRPFQEEVDLCLRYYAKSFALNTAPVQNVGSFAGAARWAQAAGPSVSQSGPVIYFPKRMRATPTVTRYNPAAANAEIRNSNGAIDWSASTTEEMHELGFGLQGTSPAGSAAGDRAFVHWSADAEL